MKTNPVAAIMVFVRSRMGGARSRTPQARLAPQQVLISAVAFAALTILLSVLLVLQPPWLGIEFQPSADGAGLIIESVAAAHPNAGELERGGIAVALIDGSGRVLQLGPRTIMEEPDILPSYTAFNGFLANQESLSEGLKTPPLHLLMVTGESVPVTTTERPVLSLPVYFWWQVLIGAACLMVGAAVWAFRRGQPAPRLLLLSGISALGFAALAAVYSSRELALDGDIFRLISALTHLFTLLHVAALLALIWIYPRPLGSAPVPTAIFSLAALAWLLDSLQFTPSAVWSHYLYANAAFIVGLIFVYGQWRATRNRPVERAVMRWFVLAIFFASLANVALLKAPVLFGMRPLVGQGWVFVAHLLMYVGLALGVMRYRLFDLERWWFKAWLWFFAGLAVIAVDLALLLILDVDRTQALIFSVVMAGWLYFPVRQWAWSHLVRRSGAEIPELVPSLTMRLISANSAEQINAGWPQALRDIFAPLELHEEPLRSVNISIAEDGTLLHVPALNATHGLALYYPAHGRRLFRPADIERVEVLLDIARSMAGAAQAREEGARSERERIMRDLHDDLGARLLSLVYAAESERAQYLARAAVDDLHGVLASAHGETVVLKTAIDQWCAESTRRVHEAGLNGTFSVPSVAFLEAAESVILSARVQVNVERIIREAVSNAIRHGCPATVNGEFRYTAGVLTIHVIDDGMGADSTQWQSGHGLRTMQARAREIGADVQWQCPAAGGCQVTLCLRLLSDDKVDEAGVSGLATIA